MASDLGKPGTVVEVLSGDTIIVMGDDTRGRPPMKKLNLSSLSAPRLAFHSETDDEAFAWPSREFLRRLLIGKKVRFQLEYSRGRDASKYREFAAVHLGDRNVGELVAEHGWAHVDGESATRFGKAYNYEELERLSAQAKQDSRGIFQGADLSSVRDVKYGVSNPKSFLAKVKGEPQHGIVQRVRDGASMQILLVPSFDLVTFYLAGVQCPRVNAGGRVGAASGAGAGGEAKPQPEPHALEAKHNTMKRLTHRDVTVHFGGVDSYGNFVGRVEHPKGDIAEVLLKMGLARMVDRSLDAVEPKRILSMRAAENFAKDRRLRLWKGWAPATVSGEQAFEGTVSEVPSGDTVVVTVEKGTPSAPRLEHRRVTLASIRAPRMGRRGEGMEPYAMHARELLRTALIGQQVLVTIDYARQPAEGAVGLAARERRCGTIVLKSAPRDRAEPAIELVSKGYCTVVRHRADENKASSYDSLMIAEQEAKKASRGVHGKRNSDGTVAGPVYTSTDISARANLMRDELPFLQRERSMAAVVEYVMAGGRFKVRVPERKCEMVLALAGVRCPRTARSSGRGSDGAALPARDGEPFGDVASEYCKNVLTHRDVTISVEDADQRGTALGTLIFDLNGKEVNIGTDLLQRGLARFIPRGAPGSLSAEYEAAQESARSARRGLWEEEEEEAEAEEEVRTTETITRMTVSEVVDGVNVMMQADGDRSRLDRVQDYMQQLLEQHGTSPAPVETRKNSIVAALFTDEDGAVAWYRARVEGPLSEEEKEAAGAASGAGAGGEKLHKVLFIDYGNMDAVPQSMMRPVGSSTIAAIPPLARPCTLAFMRCKPIEDQRLGEAARASLAALTLNESFRCRIHGRDASNRMRVTLLPVSDDDSYPGVELMEQGFHRLSFIESRDAERRLADDRSDAVAVADAEYVKLLREAQDTAKKAGENLWEFGDVADSDDDGR